jgi:hypothetical protein
MDGAAWINVGWTARVYHDSHLESRLENINLRSQVSHKNRNTVKEETSTDEIDNGGGLCSSCCLSIQVC